MEPSFLPTTIPFTPNAKPAVVSSYAFDGYWARKDPWLDGSTVLDQRTGLGTPRPPEPRRCLEFNGTNQYGWIPIDPVTEFPFTVFGWARKTETTIQDLCGVSAFGSSNIYYSFRINHGDRVGLNRRNTTIVFDDVSVPFLEDQWISYVCIFESDTEAKIYRNGLLVSDLTGLTSVTLSPLLNRFHFATRSAAAPTVYLNSKAMHTGFRRGDFTAAEALTFHQTGIVENPEVFLPLDGNSTTVAHNIGTSAAHWLEEPRRNLLRYTEKFNLISWNRTSAGLGVLPVVSQVLSPNNDLTAIRCECDRVGDTLDDSSLVTITTGSAIPAGSEATGSTWIKASTPSDIGKQVAWRHVGGAAFGTVTLTEDWVRVFRTETGSASIFTIGTRGVWSADPAVSFDIWRPQLELGDTATDYQPVLRTGIDYPEATIVNGAAGMLYEGRDVPFSRQNEVGFSERRNQSQNSEPSVSELTVVSGPPTDAAGFGQFSSSLQFPAGASFVYAYMRGSEAWVQGVTGTISVFVKMDDGLAPIFGSATVSSSLNDFVLNLRNSVMSPLLYVVEHVGDGVYRVSCTETTGNNVSNNGVVRYAGNSGRGFRVTGYQYDVAAGSSEYQRIVSEPGINVRIPALLSNPAKSAATDTLTYTGKAHFDGTLEQSNCLTFDGVDDRVLGDAIPELSINSNSSGHIRFRPNSNSSLTLIQNSFGNANRFSIFHSLGTVRIGYWNAIAYNTKSASCPSGSWYLLEWEYIAGVLTAYLNGVEMTGTDGPSASATVGFSVGTRTDGTNPFNGSICDFQVDGVIHLPMPEGAGDFVHDTIGNQAYPIVNGQASNWETKQDVYHYNITKGCTIEYDFVPSGAVFSRSNQPIQDRFGNYIVVRS